MTPEKNLSHIERSIAHSKWFRRGFVQRPRHAVFTKAYVTRRRVSRISKITPVVAELVHRFHVAFGEVVSGNIQSVT